MASVPLRGRSVVPPHVFAEDQPADHSDEDTAGLTTDSEEAFFQREQGTMRMWCQPLAPTLRCCFLPMRLLCKAFILSQVLYGALLTTVHFLLVLPPFNEPSVDMIPGSGPYMQLLDLQWSIRIRGNRDASWQQALVEKQEGGFDLNGSVMGTCIGVLYGMLVLLTSAVAFIVIHFGVTQLLCRVSHIKFLKFWLVFSLCQVAWFLFVNLCKLPTICLNSTNIRDSTEPLKIFSLVGTHCGVVRLSFTEWTVQLTCLWALGVWVAWSYTNKTIQAHQAYQAQERAKTDLA